MDKRDYRNLPRDPFANWLRKAPRFRSMAALSPRAWLKWAWMGLRYGLGPRAPLPCGGMNILPIPDRTSLAVCGDWATDTEESFAIAQLIAGEEADYTINLGDIYYVGDPQETLRNVFGVEADKDDGQSSVKWPFGKRGSFWLLGNHEMMARGIGYFQIVLPRLHQSTSWFALRNNNWLILALDTGYNSGSLLHHDAALPRQCIEWLEANWSQLNAGTPAIILLTHHMPISSFDREYPAAAKQLERFVRRPIIWIWGHEHRAEVYGPDKISPTGFTFYGRCAGHGGMPFEPMDEVRRSRPLVWMDRRTQLVDGIRTGFNGYVNLDIDGPSLSLAYTDINSIVPYRETWHAGRGGGASIPILVSSSARGNA